MLWGLPYSFIVIDTHNSSTNQSCGFSTYSLVCTLLPNPIVCPKIHCEFCENKGFMSVIFFEKKMRFQKCEFCEKQNF